MLKSSILVLLALLAACEDHDPARTTRIRTRTEVTGSRVRGKGEADEGDREDVVPTRNESEVTVVLLQYDNAKAVVRACQRMGAWPGFTVDQVVAAHPAPGCNAFEPEAHRCTIHTLRPRYVEDDDRMANQGHELEHCFHGAYHKQEER